MYTKYIACYTHIYIFICRLLVKLCISLLLNNLLGAHLSNLIIILIKQNEPNNMCFENDAPGKYLAIHHFTFLVKSLLCHLYIGLNV